MSYQLTGEGYVIRGDGAKVPITNSPDNPNTNPDYLAYLAWCAQGNTPDPAPPTPIDERQDAVWERIKSERTRREDGGVQVGGHWFQTDIVSRIKLMQLDRKAVAALAAGGTVADAITVMGQAVPWKTYDNGVVPMTVGLAQSIVSAVEVLDALAYVRAQTLRAIVNASQEPESVDITTGWPAIFEG